MMTISETVEWWINHKASDIKSNIRRDNLMASGKSVNSIRTEINSTLSFVNAKILANESVKWLDDGRGPTHATGPYKNTQTLRATIRKWLDEKGINPTDNISKDSLAFLIARKIHREGWRPKNRYPNGVISSVINDKAIKELIGSLGANVKIQVRNDIWQSFA